jgi:hypothetical protein
MAAACKDETKAYRQCLKDSHTSGCASSASKRCKSYAVAVEACREEWRRQHNIVHEFDGSRILPSHKCQPLNKKMQQCLKWKHGDQSQCQSEIQVLQQCMANEEGILAAPTEGDKVWSDYKGP